MPNGWRRRAATYHLVSGAPVPVAALRTLALGYQHLHAPRFVPPETFERARLTRAEQTLDRHVTSLYASYLQRDPWFQDANLRALSGRTCPRPDQAFLQRLIDYGIATGYLPGRTVRRTSGYCRSSPSRKPSPQRAPTLR